MWMSVPHIDERLILMSTSLGPTFGTSTVVCQMPFSASSFESAFIVSLR